MLTYYEGEKNAGSGITALLLGPVLGLLYAIFLPVIAITVASAAVGGKSANSALNAGRNAVSFGWRPVEAYLTGKKKKQQGKK